MVQNWAKGDDSSKQNMLQLQFPPWAPAPGERSGHLGSECITALWVRAPLLLRVCDSTARCTLTLCLPEQAVLDPCCHGPALLTELSPWQLPTYSNTTKTPFFKRK